MIRIACILALLLTTLLTTAQPVSSLLKEGARLTENYEEEKALKVYQQALEAEPDNLTALTEASFLSSKIGNRTEGDERDRLYRQAKDFAGQALAIDSNSAMANYAMGVAMGRIALISPTREKIEASKEVKRYAERSLRLDRSNARAWHLLGRWHMGVKDLGATKMLLIKMIYGGMPEASYESATSCYNKAINLRPDYILYYLDLAKAYQALDKTEDARAVLKKALKLEPQTPDDPRHLATSRQLLEDW